MPLISILNNKAVVPSELFLFDNQLLLPNYSFNNYGSVDTVLQNNTIQNDTYSESLNYLHKYNNFLIYTFTDKRYWTLIINLNDNPFVKKILYRISTNANMWRCNFTTNNNIMNVTPDYYSISNYTIPANAPWNEVNINANTSSINISKPYSGSGNTANYVYVNVNLSIII